MLCQNIFCLYWEDDKCILDNISIDLNGHCADFEGLIFDSATLEKVRKSNHEDCFLYQFFKNKNKHQDT